MATVRAGFVALGAFPPRGLAARAENYNSQQPPAGPRPEAGRAGSASRRLVGAAAAAEEEAEGEGGSPRWRLPSRATRSAPSATAAPTAAPTT